MKYCGCNICKANGERNLLEDFELYCSTREMETKAVFEDILSRSFSPHELNELECIAEGKSDVIRITSYGISPVSHWILFGGNPKDWMMF